MEIGSGVDSTGAALDVEATAGPEVSVRFEMSSSSSARSAIGAPTFTPVVLF